VALDVVYGEASNQVEATRLADLLSTELSDGTVYLGYPVLPSADELVVVDSLLVSPRCDLAAFIIWYWREALTETGPA
jgi:hypothetical protein